MEALMVLIGVLAFLSGPAGLILGIISIRRINHLRVELGLTSAPRVAVPVSAPPLSVPQPREPIAPSAPASAPPSGESFTARLRKAGTRGGEAGPSRPLDLEAILGGQWLTWIGVLALFFGTAFFLGVDLGENFLTGLPQLLIGLAVALAFCGVGRIWSRGETLRFLGLGLLGGGVALLFLVAYSAYGFHHLVPLGAVLPMLLGVAIAGALLALERNSVTVAALTLTGALLTPILLPNTDGLNNALLPYLVAVNLGAVVVGLRRGWAGLPLASFAGASLLIAFWMDGQYEPQNRLFAFVFVGASWLIFALSPRIRGLRETVTAPAPSRRFGPPAQFWSLARGLVTVANGLLFGLFCYRALQPDAVRFQGLALAVLAACYLVLSLYLNHVRSRDASARMSFHTAVTLAVLAVPVQFDLSWITLGWTALAAVLLLHGVSGPDRSHRIAGLAVLALALVRVLTFDLPGAQGDPAAFHFLLNGQFLTGLVVAGLLGWVAWSYRRGRFELAPFETRLITPMILLAVTVLWWKGTFELAAWWKLRALAAQTRFQPQSLVSISLFWMLYTGAILGAGLATRFRPLRGIGLVLLVLTTVKVVLWDSLTGRPFALGLRPFTNGTFLTELLLPVLLAGAAWAFHQYRARLSTRELRLPTPLLLTALSGLIWVVTAEILYHFSFRESMGLASSERQSLLTLSLVWALYSGIVIAVGFLARFKPMRLLGIALLTITIAKVFVVDLTTLERGYRIAAFIGLGVLVLAISLLYQKRRPRSA